MSYFRLVLFLTFIYEFETNNNEKNDASFCDYDQGCYYLESQR